MIVVGLHELKTRVLSLENAFALTTPAASANVEQNMAVQFRTLFTMPKSTLKVSIQTFTFTKYFSLSESDFEEAGTLHAVFFLPTLDINVEFQGYTGYLVSRCFPTSHRNVES